MGVQFIFMIYPNTNDSVYKAFFYHGFHSNILLPKENLIGYIFENMKCKREFDLIYI